MGILGKDALGSRNGMCKGPGEARSLLCLRNSKKDNMSGKAQGTWERSENPARARSGGEEGQGALINQSDKHGS